MMYSLVYGFFYLLSRLPFRVLYVLSDVVYLILYYVAGYRRKLVMEHLYYTFPEKTEAQRVRIAKDCYHNFCDTWIETIKAISITEAQLRKRVVMDASLLEAWHAKGVSIQIVGGHFMNWEYLPLGIPALQPFTALAIYMPLSSQIMERLMLSIRRRFGLVLLRAGNMKAEMKPWQNHQYLMLVGADQSPSNPLHAYWLQFCNRPTGFVQGPWLRAVKSNQPHVYLRILKPKRGYYRFEVLPFSDAPATEKPQVLAMRYARQLEQDIKASPALYLWTHKRWKKTWQPDYRHLWIDDAPMPEINS